MLVAYEELAGVVKLIRNGEIVWKMKPRQNTTSWHYFIMSFSLKKVSNYIILSLFDLSII